MNFDHIIAAMRDSGCTETQVLDTIQRMVRAEKDARAAAEQAEIEERRAKDRERKRLKREAPSANSTNSSGSANSSGKRGKTEAPIEHVPPRAKLDPSTKGNIPPEPLRGSTPKGVEASNRGTRLADEFKPDFEIAHREGLSRTDAEREFDRFRDYFRAATGPRAVKRDWDATWRNWCRKAADDKRRRLGTDPPKRGSAALAELARKPFSEVFR